MTDKTSIRNPLLCAILLICSLSTHAQHGCTDKQAINFNSLASINDGSCIYSFTEMVPKVIAQLPPVLDECSGLAFVNSHLWTILDAGNPERLYAIDTSTAGLLLSLTIPGVSNNDWEDLTEDSEHLYIGDFGNNSGNRKNLQIIKIKKPELHAGVSSPEFINFSFSDQFFFGNNQNAHDYDCEAFFFFKDSLHLFSKNWVDNKTRHYVLPAKAGTHVAQLRDSFDAKGLITGAAITAEGQAVLLGYNAFSTEAFIWLFHDYQGTGFFRGNKRKLTLGYTFLLGRPEGICFRNGARGYIVSEWISSAPGQLFSFDLSAYLPKLVKIKEHPATAHPVRVWPNPVQDILFVEMPAYSGRNIRLTLTDGLGRVVWKSRNSIPPDGEPFQVHLGQILLPRGNYTLKLESGTYTNVQKISLN